ncbi:YceI family protein [Cecembia rubra]|uniref:YceI family protein n=1 Tax=Cecembia rubra TaxID=1485585 RepID=UPI0027156071|nr:YceI family protein [Cecembia rubra]
MKAQVIFCLLFFLALIRQPLDAQQFVTDNGKVTFISKASLSEFEGKSNLLQGVVDLDKNLLDFYLDLNTIKTGIGLRDRHMRENYLETKKFPFAEFTGKIQDIPTLEIGQEKSVRAKGKFKIHGVEREIEVPGKLKKLNEQELSLSADFKVLLSDYNISIPKVMFYELAEEQIVIIDAVLKKK